MKLVSWNAEGRLTRFAEYGKRGSPEHILNEIESFDADVVVLPDAYREVPEPGVNQRFYAMGYTWHDVAYRDKGREEVYKGKMPHMRILSRLAVVDAGVTRWDDVRTLAAVTIEDRNGEVYDVFGVHLDDRSSEVRHGQVVAMSEMINARKDRSDAIIATGDWNERHKNSRRLGMLGGSAVRSCMSWIPHDTVRYYGTTVTDMLAGEAIEYFEQVTGMRTLDPDHRPTTTPKIHGGLEWMPSVRVIQLDHMYVTEGIKDTGLIISKDGGSDHRAIMSTVNRS